MQKVFPDDFLDIGASFTSEGRELSDFQKKHPTS